MNRYQIEVTYKKARKIHTWQVKTSQNCIIAAHKLAEWLTYKNKGNNIILVSTSVKQIERLEPAINLSDNNYGVQAKQFKPTFYHLPVKKLQSC